MQHIRSRCERVRLPDTLGVMMFDPPPQEVFDNTFKRFKDFSHLFRKCKICGRKVSRRSKITPRNRTSGTTEFVHHGCVFRGRDEYPVCGKSARSNSCSQKYYDRWCRTILQCC
ncbi:hypothetical protein TNCV_3922071 [Trichonephila clavipes]|nr:hypothetical protein TNCV_3922071 [Trichonephila clavipes]